MITFKQYLNEALTRTRQVSVDELMSWCDKNASKYLKGTRLLYRGGSGTSSNLLIGDPAKGKPRESANTSNHYTLWLDNHPTFDGWPRRSRAFIATTLHDTAESFGDASIIIPDDTAKIGIVGQDDLWFVDIGNGTTFESLAADASNMIDLVLGDGHVKTYEELKKGLLAVTPEALEEVLKNQKMATWVRAMVASMIKDLRDGKFDNMYEMWDKLVTPKLFDRTDGANVSRRNVSGEVWIEGECAFIPVEADHIKLEERMELLDWSEEKYPSLNKMLKIYWELDEE